MSQLQNEEENLKKFIENFFKNLECNIENVNNELIISKVPNDFERLYGKNAPYKFVFNNKYFNNNELVTKGSSIFKVMANYLEKKAQTTLLKIKLNPDLNYELKRLINFNDYEITGISKKENYDPIYRFTFISLFQYLNEKEQLITKILVHDNGIIDNFNIENYETEEGKKKDINLEKVKENYLIARENLKEILKSKTVEISDFLTKSLDSEVWRIETHYLRQVHEIDNEINNNLDKIKELEEKLKDSSNQKSINERIKRLKEAIEKLKISNDKEKFDREKEFFIKDEKQKHVLNISNNLMNTTIIYYPILSLKVQVKNKELIKDFKIPTREIDFTYNPLTRQLDKILCKSCKSEIKEINFCSLGHLSCKKCLLKCPSCFTLICNSCKTVSCNICNMKMCGKCQMICTKCQKPVCKSHSCIDNASGRTICNNCSMYCNVCNKFSDKSYFKKCDSCRSDICSRCFRSKIINGKSRIYCKNCN